MNKVFAYGTLRYPDVRKKLLGHDPVHRSSSLKGFRMGTITLDGVVYPIIAEDLLSDETIEGVYFQVNDDDLQKLDEYESDAYKRKLVELEDKVIAWVYYA